MRLAGYTAVLRLVWVVDAELIYLFASTLREIFVWLESPILLLEVSEPFDVVEIPVPMGDASLDFVHVVFFICLHVAYFPMSFGEVGPGYWAVSGYEWL